MKKEVKHKPKKERPRKRYADMVEELDRETREWKRKQKKISSLEDAMML